MALFKPYKITSDKLEDLAIQEGQIIITTDTKKLYVDVSNTERIEITSEIDLSNYVTTNTLTSTIAEEASARQKQDQLLEQAIDDKLGADDVVAGSNVQVSHDDETGHITISATDTKYTAGTGLGMIGNGFYLLNGGVGLNQLANDSVSEDKLVDGAVDTAKIADGAVTVDKLAANIIPDVSEFITESEANAAYAAKEHNHDDRYYTESEIDSKLEEKSDIGHIHDDRYYTESEINTLLGAKANVEHAHSADDITSGVLALDRIPSIPNSHIANLSADKLTGVIPSTNLPSYVDDVVEYNGVDNFPETGESGKIYVDTSANTTYRWSGTEYVAIGSSLALGETSSTAFRGDYGKVAYDHAQAKGSAFSSGLYKITTNAQGHVTAATAVQKSDITALGIPAQDTNTTYSNATTSTAGLMSAADKIKLEGIATEANKYVLPVATEEALGGVKVGFPESGKNYPVELNSDNQMFVNVPWTDTNTTYTLGSFGITATAAELNYMDGVTSNVQTQLNGKAASSHTHNYAGSSTAGGSATSAVKLDSSAGSATQPVYFSGGKPVATTYTLGASVPSGAKFTDTTYSAMTGATTSAAGKAGLVPAPAAGAATRYLRSDGTWQVPPDTNTTYTLSSFGITATAAELNKLDGCTATVTELNYVDGVTSNIQTQLNGKAASSHTHSYLPLSGGTLTGTLTSRAITPSATNTYNIGTSSMKFANVYATTFVGALSGNATTATTATKANQLTTARTITASLSSSTAGSFNGTANITVGTTGTLPISKGGTGATTAAAARSNLAAAPSDIVLVQSAQPTSSTCKLWIKI